MKVYGLIGYPLSHSFSKKYFSEKFLNEGIEECVYNNYELESIDLFNGLIQNESGLKGLNVTIPYKQDVIQFLDELHPAAEKIGAVNVIKLQEGGKLVGYNSDYYGFQNALLKLIPENYQELKALVFGTGGASRAVNAALENLGIEYLKVSRSKREDTITYSEITEEFLTGYKMLINTSPLGMSPNVDTCPDIPYSVIDSGYYLYDLVYNPLETLFMKKGKEAGAAVANGLEMLHLQAEKAWEIWNS